MGSDVAFLFTGGPRWQPDGFPSRSWWWFPTGRSCLWWIGAGSQGGCCSCCLHWQQQGVTGIDYSMTGHIWFEPENEYVGILSIGRCNDLGTLSSPHFRRTSRPSASFPISSNAWEWRSIQRLPNRTRLQLNLIFLGWDFHCFTINWYRTNSRRSSRKCRSLVPLSILQQGIYYRSY